MIAGSSLARPAATMNAPARPVWSALPAEQVLDHRDPLLGGQGGVGEGGAQLVGPFEGPGEPEQLVFDLGQLSLGAAHLEQRVGVGLDPR